MCYYVLYGYTICLKKGIIMEFKKCTCCFIGHRKINETEALRVELCRLIKNLIVNENVDTFLFGSKGEFNTLCYEIVTQIKEKYPYLRRIYVRAEYPFISEQYKMYLLENYDDTYYPEKNYWCRSSSICKTKL